MTEPVERRHLAGRQPDGDPDRPYRDRARRIFDQLIYAQREIATLYADADGFWEPPAYLGESGDGHGLLNVGRGQLIRPMRAALEKAEAEMRALREEIDADVARRIGVPGYRTHPED